MILTKQKYDEKLRILNNLYWNRSAESRWQYMKNVINKLHNIQFETILEIGAYKVNLTELSDNMDVIRKYIDEDNINNKIYIQDAGNPWTEIEDDYYDVVLALQVFEHLEGKQKQAFDELKRCAVQAIITIPWHWNCPNDKNHHNITEQHCLKWFGNDYKDYVYKDEIHSNRRMLCFRF
jgi:hypothetical protein